MTLPVCIGAGVASISESELLVYWSPDIPEHHNMPNLGTPGTVTTLTDSVFTDVISNSHWTSFKFVCLFRL